MRLINTQTLGLEEFFGDDIPRYAILSHTWVRNQEVTFQEWTANCRALSHMNGPKKKGYDKIESACRVAQNSRLQYLWVDTNCIDKSSSAELSEAINSMFSWYSKSAVCFAYLEDVSADELRLHYYGEERNYPNRNFEESKWFTRGWTLQELIAPENLVFYSREWILLGTKYDLHSRIKLCTGIPREFIGGDLKGASNAQIMSWASTRSTTRSEDIAYCLLGLFKINMPLLYGEGKRAFYRLQEEIIRKYNDHSLFCWTATLQYSDGYHQIFSTSSILASEPQRFDSHRNVRGTFKDDWKSLSYSLTNAGLRIRLPLIQTIRPEYFYIMLDANREHDPFEPLEKLCICVFGSLRSREFERSYVRPRAISLPTSWVSSSIEIYLRTEHSKLSLPQPNSNPLNYDYSALLLFEGLHYYKTSYLITTHVPWLGTQGPSMECFDDFRSTLGLPQSPMPNVYGAFFDLQTCEIHNEFELIATIFIGVICDAEGTRQQQEPAAIKCRWIYKVQPQLASKNDFIQSVMTDLENGILATSNEQSSAKVELELAYQSFSDSPGNQTRPVLIRLRDKDRTVAFERDLLTNS